MPLARHTPEFMTSAVVELEPRPDYEVASALDTSTSFRPARALTRGGPLLQSRQRPGRDRIGCSRARLVKVDEPTE
jgi:hypothetical protein